MIEKYLTEEWKDFTLNDCDPTRTAYRISNYGRVQIKTKTQKQFKILNKFAKASGFNMFFFHKKGGKAASFYVHRAVAILFLKNPENKIFVFHLDHNPLNNSFVNLKWANRSELIAHQITNPKRIQNKGHKLTAGQVKRIKRKLFDPNNKTRVKMIAKEFGITTMQVWRIKTGENWADVEVDAKYLQKKKSKA